MVPSSTLLAEEKNEEWMTRPRHDDREFDEHGEFHSQHRDDSDKCRDEHENRKTQRHEERRERRESRDHHGDREHKSKE